MFFCLIKRTKNQECRIASGRHSTPRAWVETLPVVAFAAIVWIIKNPIKEASINQLKQTVTAKPVKKLFRLAQLNR